MYKYLFGPVPSRRLGMSLGVDLVPQKVCSLNCVYCEVGKTTKLTTERLEYIPYDKVISEIDQFMANKPKIDFFTFSGSGEPTLNKRIGDVLFYLKSNFPQSKTAVLTNGTLLSKKSIRTELLKADVLLPSLDAASQEVFEKIDRPEQSLNIKEIIQGLVDLRKEFAGEIWLEVFILKNYNDTPDELALIRDAVEKIGADRVQLNTLDRPGTIDGLCPVAKEDLLEIIDQWNLPNVEIIAKPPERTQLESYSGDMEMAILETISRRPCTLEDLHELLGIHISEVNKYLGTLEANKQITTVTQERGVFYKKT